MARKQQQTDLPALTPSSLFTIEDSEIADILKSQFGELIYSAVCSASDGRLSEDEVDDCASYVVFSLCDNHFSLFRRYKGSSSVEGYLRSFCVRAAEEYILRNHFDPSKSSESLYGGAKIGLSRQNRAIMKKARDAISSELSALDPAERLALRLRFEQKMTYAEISRLLAIKDPEKILSVIFLRLRKSIEEKVDGIDSLFEEAL